MKTAGDEKLLEIKNLTVSFLNPSDPNGQTILAADRVSLELRQGIFTAMVGESGSGKSVTALSVARLVKTHQTEGEIFFLSNNTWHDLLRLSEKELRGFRGKEISYVFQDPASSFNPVMRVGGQIREAYEAHFDADPREGREKTLRQLEAVRMKDPERVYRSFPHELSGGMKQRAMIAMALISGPKLLIADEPTAALDAQTESDILQLLLSLQKERKLSILFITHNLPRASEFAKRIYVMKKGKIVERMEKSADGFHPVESYTQSLFNVNIGLLKPKSFIGV